MAQISIENNSSGSFDNVMAWQPLWGLRLWRSYKESSLSKSNPAAFRSQAQNPPISNWEGSPVLGTGLAPVGRVRLLDPDYVTNFTSPKLLISQGRWTLSFERPFGVDLNYNYRLSQNLSDWTTLTPGVDFSLESNVVGATEEVTLTLENEQASGTTIFMQIYLQ